MLEAEKMRKDNRRKKKTGPGKGDKGTKSIEGEKPKPKLKWGDEGKLKMSIAL